MFVYITWGLVGILLFLLAKRIGAGVVGVGVFVGAVFLTIFMLDTFTVINVRNFVPVHFYDDTIEDPKGAVTKVGEKLGEAGEKSADKINGIGENANRYFEVEESKEKGDKTWVKRDEVTEKEKSSKKDAGDADEKKEKKGSSKKEEEPQKGKKGATASGSSTFVKYTEIDSLLQTRYKELPHEDIEILKAISPILRTKVEGEKIVVDNRGENYKEGFMIHMK